MKNKKIFSSLALAIAALSLFSCSGNTPNNSSTATTPTTPTVTGPGSTTIGTPEVNDIIYVAPDGNAQNDGKTPDSPLDFFMACRTAKPGQTIVLKGGVYNYSYRIELETSGAPNNYINVVPEEGKEVIFDFSKMRFESANRGIQIYGDFWHFNGITIRGAGDNGMYIAGDHNIIENCIFYNNRDSGLQLGRGFSSETQIKDWPSFNLIKNCTSYGNYDDETKGENADGFAAKLTVGYGNIFDGCIAFRNSDDGWDLYAKMDSGNIGTVVLYNCVSFENGFLPYQIEQYDYEGNPYMTYNTPDGDGIGFKLGGSTMEGDVIVENCIAFNNKLHGFGDNSNPGVLNLRNCSAINNCIGLNDDGTVAERGLPDTVNKSNNFDLARDNNSYNNHYGLLSYINNQENFVDDEDSSYNKDAFRGSVAYSIFQTNYKSGEVYTMFEEYADASIYKTERVDATFESGQEFNGMNDACFADLNPYNAICDSRETLDTLEGYHLNLRNKDQSVNLGDKFKVVDPYLLTFADGKQVGAALSKTSYEDYTHYIFAGFEDCKTADDVAVKSVYNVLEILADENAVYQDFEIPKYIYNCDISWSTSNENILKVNNNEKISVSKTIFSSIEVTCPIEPTEVTVTATISCGESVLTKDFKVTVRGRNQSLGFLVNEGDSAMRVDIYGFYSAPRVYATDSSSSAASELSSDLYDLSYSYKYAKDKNSTYYLVDNIYTSMPGAYEVTVTAESKIVSDNNKKMVLVYYVYVVDPDCSVDFVNGEYSIKLIRDGYAISGNLSNIDGYVYSIYSETQLTLTPEQLIAKENVQKQEILTDNIVANFNADNSAGKEYYGYFTVSNRNNSNQMNVYSFKINTKSVATQADFNTLARTGTLPGVEDPTQTIFNLESDLDFTDYKYNVVTTGTFSGLFNGNNHTISNLAINENGEKNINVFFKVTGTVMNVKFENIDINNTNIKSGKQVGIIGELQGGYVHNVHVRNANVSSYQSSGAVVGQATGGDNYISLCSLVNDADHKIFVYSKYGGGIIGNVQKNSDQTSITITVTDCYSETDLGAPGDSGIGIDTGGNYGGIVGRVKNDDIVYYTTVERCFYKGTILANGNYNGGIVGGFEAGIGNIRICNNYALPVFILKGIECDAYKVFMSRAEDATKYAHKNASPIVGRYTSFMNEVFSENNLGSWCEYSSTFIQSYSIYFNLSSFDEETGELYMFTPSVEYFANLLQMDFENTWHLNDDGTIILIAAMK